MITVYPLQQVLQVKQRRVEEAEKVLKEKIALLEQEKEKLKQREAERDKVLNHKKDKLTQLRLEMDRGTTVPKIQQMKAYLKVVQEKLVAEEKKVTEQQKHVQTAETNVENARKELQLRRQEVDKIEMHKTDWLKEMQKEIELAEGREMDEVGNVIYLSKLRYNKQL